MSEDNFDNLPVIDDDDLPKITHWNYRVIRRTYEVFGEKEERFAIHEVYYEDDKPRMCSVEPDAPHGMTLDELRQDLQWQLEALDKPVLDYEKDFPTAEEDGD